MTLFLAGVKDKFEAEIAIAHGADLIDLVDTGERAFDVTPELALAMSEAIAGRRPIWASAGGARAEPEAVRRAAEGLAAAGVDCVRIALAQDAGLCDRIAALASLGSRIKLMGVLFAEEGPSCDLIDRLAEAGFSGVMLDTARKPGKRLLDLCDHTVLARFVEASRRRGLLSGLSGALEPPDVPRLLPLKPDVLGFRGALSLGGDRRARLDPKAISLLRDLIPAEIGGREPPAILNDRVDYRLLTGRNPMPEAGESASPSDRIFVRDLVLPVRIGAYRSEHETPQRVRFNVEAHVTRPAQRPADMRDILSYDVITDGIQRIVGEAHIDLVETLAERIAELVLAQPRVTRTIVRVEKLDTGPGSVGVEITRERPGGAAALRRSLPAAGNEN